LEAKMPRKRSYAQGHRVRRISWSRYVKGADFQAGFNDRIAGKPPIKFAINWHYEHGRELANGAVARGIIPAALLLQAQAKLLQSLFDDGSIV
jgi:hypothetical protein